MLPQRRNTHGGDHSGFNVLFLISIGIFNIINQLTNKDSLKGITFTGIFFIIAFLVYILPFRKIILAYLFLFLALAVHYSMIDPSGFSSASLFVLAYSNRSRTRFGILVLFLTVVIITYKASISGDTPSQFILSISLYVFLYGNFYFEIFSKLRSPIRSRISNLTEKENALISGMASGINKKKIFSNIGVTEAIGYDMIKKIKNKLDAETTEEITYKLGLNNDSKNRYKK